MLNSPCFGKGWDGLTEKDCRECSGQHSCKDRFVTGTFREYMSVEENKNKTNEELSKAFSISIPSIEECRNAYNAIMGDDEEMSKTTDEVKEVSEPETVTEQQVEVVKNPKQRRGRKPVDLIPCPVCGGTGYDENGNECSICGGYGDISEKKWKASQLKEASKDIEKVIKKSKVKEAHVDPKDVPSEEELKIVDLDKVREERKVGLNIDKDELFNIMRTGPIKNINMEFVGITGKKKCLLGVVVSVDADLILND